ncbi:MAG: hypothetical protein KDH88_13170 [Chromatiales bacterium]|nr:hypothetical protein [Chromatiales bacterium]
MGGVFARGLLRTGWTLIPLNRGDSLAETAERVPDPEMVLVAVAEKDLHPVLGSIPEAWRDRIALLQNELLPADWKRHGFEQPTVISVWFEKKPGREFKVLIPSPAYGPGATLLVDALTSLGIAARSVSSAEDLLFELVLKNVYIVTTNVCGLVTGGTVSQLWAQHEALARQVADEVMDIQATLTGQDLNRAALIEGMLTAFDGDPEHQCMGRSAPARLARALVQADAAKLAVPKLREIAARSSQ